MDSHQLQAFLTVWRLKSFSAAAEELGTAPSSISRTIAGLEAELGARLFQRTTRAMQPTDAGLRLYEKAAPLIEDWEDLRASISGEDREPRGLLRVTASIAFARIIIAPMLARFTEAYPEVRVELALSDQRVNLIENQIDVAIRHGAMEDSSLIARRLLSASYRLVASPSLLENQPRLENPAQLSQRPLVSFSFGEFRSNWTFARGDETVHVPVEPAITASNALVVREAAIAGAGYSLLADWMIAEDLAAGRLVEVLPEWRVTGTLETSDLWLVYPSSRLVPRKTRAFADFLTEAVSSLT
ncbi:LysR family transcriptional regulator [uncultured Erythrobacter sp.]|uniref:LysR family transcriptional regulator n=1 Tax=uncultured Erythrobacter sp. TaxID=263913 RepID=UPI002614EC7B|nr:LysR family transcriptional regulator [uncultured Erythrobacter sp.]